MEKLQTMTHPQFGQLSIIILDGKEMFKAKEVASMLGYKDTINAVKQHCKGVVKYSLPSKSGKQTFNLIPEGDLWRLIIRSKLPQAEQIEKWIMDEVLPTIRKTGSYTMPKQEGKQLTFEEYSYFDKKYNGEYVLSTMDVSALTNINTTTISWYARAHLNGGVDYYFISGDKLREFKAENPKVSKLASGLTVFRKSGFEKICRAYNIKVDTPHPFIKAAFKPKAELEKKERKLNTLGFEVERAVILENPKIQSYIKEITGCLKAMETLLMLYNSDNLSIESAKRKADSICDIAAAITGKSVALYCTKLETKIVKY